MPRFWAKPDYLRFTGLVRPWDVTWTFQLKTGRLGIFGRLILRRFLGCFQDWFCKVFRGISALPVALLTSDIRHHWTAAKAIEVFEKQTPRPRAFTVRHRKPWAELSSLAWNCTRRQGLRWVEGCHCPRSGKEWETQSNSSPHQNGVVRICEDTNKLVFPRKLRDMWWTEMETKRASTLGSFRCYQAQKLWFSWPVLKSQLGSKKATHLRCPYCWNPTTPMLRAYRLIDCKGFPTN